MEARRTVRSYLSALRARESVLPQSEQEKLEARIATAKDEVRRAMALFNEHLAGLAQTIMALQAELSRARQGSWVPEKTLRALEERLEIAEQGYAEVEWQRQQLVLEPLRRVEQTEIRLVDARRRSDIALAAAEAGEALDRLRDSLAEALTFADARVELEDPPALPPG